MSSNLKLKFEIECKETQLGEELFIIGNSKELGNWNVNNSQKLITDSSKFPLWESNEINFKKKNPLEYKYIIKNSSNVKWENFPENRILNLQDLKENNYIINDGKFNDKSNQKITKSSGEEINIPNINSPNKKLNQSPKKKIITIMNI
jgi:hypothetical protein